jgi:hypothetical protein
VSSTILIDDVRPPSSSPVPVAAVRLSGPDLRAVGRALAAAGFAVVDVRAHRVGPAPRVVVLELPADELLRRRLLTAGADGPSRILIAPQLTPGELELVRSRRDIVVHPPFHALRVVTEALRLAKVRDGDLAGLAVAAFEDLGRTG